MFSSSCAITSDLHAHDHVLRSNSKQGAHAHNPGQDPPGRMHPCTNATLDKYGLAAGREGTEADLMTSSVTRPPAFRMYSASASDHVLSGTTRAGRQSVQGQAVWELGVGQ